MNKKGFSLIELLVVIGILSILASIAIPMYRGHLRRAQRAEAFTNLQSLRLLEERYYSQNGTYVAWDCNAADNLTAIRSVLPQFQPGSSLRFRYCLTLNQDINGNAQTPCFSITATGNNGTLVAGETYSIDCNNNKSSSTGVAW